MKNDPNIVCPTCKYPGHENIPSDGKSYKLVMNGFNIVTDIVISK